MKKIDRILLVDDDKATNYLHKTLLNQLNLAHHVDVVFNGKDAINHISSCPRENLPNLILLDVNMPHMNGFDFLENYLKLDEYRQTAVKLLMVTSSLGVNNIEKLEEYKDIIHLVEKPLTVTKILEIWSMYFPD